MTSRCLRVIVIAVVGSVLLTSCRCTIGNESIAMAESGPEDWSIGGTVYHLNRTYYLRQGIQQVVYVIEYNVKNKVDLVGMIDENALRVAFPLMVYAYRSNAYLRTQFRSLRGHETAYTLIGVDLVVDGHEYRITQSVGEIVWRLKGGQPG